MPHETYMQRCFDLARLGAGNVSPNPMVGAVLVHGGRIIGEGWHRQYGQAHAEVNCIASVKPADLGLIPHATLYVSLEPCCIHGNTPPCTKLILAQKIGRVVISCLDATPQVQGRGVEILRSAGVEVTTGVLEEAGKRLSSIRNTFVSQKRPYIQLKFARSMDGMMGQVGRQVWISNLFSKRLAHKGRSAFDAILVGTTTALIDNPQLTNRLWFGKSPLRIVLDRAASLPRHLALFDDTAKTWWVVENSPTDSARWPHIQIVQLPFDADLLPRLLARLHEERISSLIVEGGAHTLHHFIEGGWWDEAAVFTSNRWLGTGIPAPTLSGKVLVEEKIGNDFLTVFVNE